MRKRIAVFAAVAFSFFLIYYLLKPYSYLTTKVIPPSPPCEKIVADARFEKAELRGNVVMCKACVFTKDDKWKSVFAVNPEHEVILPSGYIKEIIDPNIVVVSTVAKFNVPTADLVYGTDNSMGCIDREIPAGYILVR